jgi:hypothetical protein
LPGGNHLLKINAAGLFFGYKTYGRIKMEMENGS